MLAFGLLANFARHEPAALAALRDKPGLARGSSDPPPHPHPHHRPVAPPHPTPDRHRGLRSAAAPDLGPAGTPDPPDSSPRKSVGDSVRRRDRQWSCRREEHQSSPGRSPTSRFADRVAGPPAGGCRPVVAVSSGRRADPASGVVVGGPDAAARPWPGRGSVAVLGSSTLVPWLWTSNPPSRARPLQQRARQAGMPAPGVLAPGIPAAGVLAAGCPRWRLGARSGGWSWGCWWPRRR